MAFIVTQNCILTYCSRLAYCFVFSSVGYEKSLILLLFLCSSLCTQLGLNAAISRVKFEQFSHLSPYAEMHFISNVHPSLNFIWHCKKSGNLITVFPRGVSLSKIPYTFDKNPIVFKKSVKNPWISICLKNLVTKDFLRPTWLPHSLYMWTDWLHSSLVPLWYNLLIGDS